MVILLILKPAATRVRDHTVMSFDSQIRSSFCGEGMLVCLASIIIGPAFMPGDANKKYRMLEHQARLLEAAGLLPRRCMPLESPSTGVGGNEIVWDATGTRRQRRA